MRVNQQANKPFIEFFKLDKFKINKMTLNSIFF